jgi:transcriptional regulator with XRE-family HTH domain
MSDFEANKSPGAVIGAARKQRGWTLDDMSERTKIPSGMLAALEADEFHRLSGPLYTRSFVRSCAKELGLPVDEVLALLDGLDGEAPRAVVAPLPHTEKVRIRRVGLPWGRIAAGAVVVCGLAVGAVLLTRGGDEGAVPGAVGGSGAGLATLAEEQVAGGGGAAAETLADAAARAMTVTADSLAPVGDGAVFADGLAWPLVVKLVAAAPVPLAVRRDAETDFLEVAWATAANDTLPAAGIEAGRAYTMGIGGMVVYWGAVNGVSLRLGTVQGITLTVNGRPRALVAPPGGGEVTVDLTAAEPSALP